MPKTAPASAAGYGYHVLDRGNARVRVCHDAADYHDFVRLLRPACAPVPSRLLAYCLMARKPRDMQGSLSEQLQARAGVWPRLAHTFLRLKNPECLLSRPA